MLLGVMSVMTLSSCGVGSALVVNQNQNTTHVHLSSNNYKIVGSATGSSEVSYILIFGGLSKKQIYENAYADMVSKANLESGSRALANIMTEEFIGGFPPFAYTRRITVSCKIIEFTR